jgi:uncharacterized protein YndB with AHSA1/START domain
MTAPREIVLHRGYATSPEDVWAAFTESDRLARWFGRYTGHGRPGGTVELTVTGELDAGGEVADPVTVAVHECAPPHRLVVEVPSNGTGSWWIAVDIAPEGDGAALTFTQRLVDGITAEEVTAGWRWYLDRLGAVLDGGPKPAWSDYAP